MGLNYKGQTGIVNRVGRFEDERAYVKVLRITKDNRLLVEVTRHTPRWRGSRFVIDPSELTIIH